MMLAFRLSFNQSLTKKNTTKNRKGRRGCIFEGRKKKSLQKKLEITKLQLAWAEIALLWKTQGCLQVVQKRESLVCSNKKSRNKKQTHLEGVCMFCKA